MSKEDLRELLKKHHKQSYIWALRCCFGRKDDAEEALQESYLKILDGKAIFNNRSDFKTWLFSVIRITVADFRRKNILEALRRIEINELYNLLTVKTYKDTDLVNEEIIFDRLEKSLSELSPKQELMLRLVFYHDFTIEQSADIMGISIGTARTHYERGKKNLKLKIN